VLAATIACVGLVSACGGTGIPADAVATVDGSPITKAALYHWIGITVNSRQAPGSKITRQPVPIPPDFTACIAFHRATDAKPGPGRPSIPTASLKTECQAAYTGALTPVMAFLITTDWFEGEAAAEGIKVSTATVRAQLSQDEAATVAQGTTPTAAALEQYLAAIGETSQDELYRIRGQVLSTKLGAKALAAAPKATPAEIATYYKANSYLFDKPETRDLRVVLVAKLATARRVIALLKTGTRFAKLARELSIDPKTKSRGGLLVGQAETASSLPTNLAAAVFKAPVGSLEGPIKTSRGYEVFRVQKITKARQEPLSQASASISSTMSQQRQAAANSAFLQTFDTKWLDLTKCAPGFAVSSTPRVCANAPTAAPQQ
jgi:foldase protein PrsA